jgi:hypothetical protein
LSTDTALFPNPLAELGAAVFSGNPPNFYLAAYPMHHTGDDENPTTCVALPTVIDPPSLKNATRHPHGGYKDLTLRHQKCGFMP